MFDHVSFEWKRLSWFSHQTLFFVDRLLIAFLFLHDCHCGLVHKFEEHDCKDGTYVCECEEQVDAFSISNIRLEKDCPEKSKGTCRIEWGAGQSLDRICVENDSKVGCSNNQGGNCRVSFREFGFLFRLGQVEEYKKHATNNLHDDCLNIEIVSLTAAVITILLWYKRERLLSICFEKVVGNQTSEKTTCVLENNVANTELSRKSTSIFAKHEGESDSWVEVWAWNSSTEDKEDEESNEESNSIIWLVGWVVKRCQ